MSDPILIGVDCDLRASYAVSATGVAAVDADPLSAVSRVMEPGLDHLVLYEIASPLDYTDDKAIAYNKRRWTIWNVAQAVSLDAALRAHGAHMLVAPSHDWTRGFPLGVRHKMAGCLQPQKDRREAEAMIWFYRHHPAAWRPLSAFLAGL